MVIIIMHSIYLSLFCGVEKKTFYNSILFYNKATLISPLGYETLTQGPWILQFWTFDVGQGCRFFGLGFFTIMRFDCCLFSPTRKALGIVWQKKLYFFYSRDPPMKPKGWFVISFTIYTPLLVMMFQKCFQKVKKN